MKSNYKQIREKNIEEYGKGTRHLSYFSDLYSKRTHFIYEILQNAEDALYRRLIKAPEGYVSFSLYNNRLEIRHNGAPFTEKDVIGICGIDEGTKHDDYTQIGKFGIGFKSVYAYTFFPAIYSGDEQFEIRRFVEPLDLGDSQRPIPIKYDETCIVLPFDYAREKPDWAFRKLLPIEQAVNEIGNALRGLSIRALLFLQHINEINWVLPDGSSGQLLRKKVENDTFSRFVTVTDGDSIEEWIIFRKPAAIPNYNKDDELTVEVAFRLEDKKVRRSRNTELVAYFATEKKTGLGFLIQAPFKTTKARDNIKQDEDDFENQNLLETAAYLVANCMGTMRDLKLLDASSYLALPLQVPEDGFFQPIYDSVRQSLKKEALLPGYGGIFVKAEEAKLARGRELVELFSPEQLGLLFGKEKLFWLDASITEKGPLEDLHAYLVGRKKYYNEWEIEPLRGGLLVEADTLAPKLTADFLREQPISWLVKFIKYVAAPNTSSAIKRTPFIRLASGDQVPLPADAEKPRTAWFVPENASALDLSAFPLVHPGLAAYEKVHEFLEKEGIREIDEVAIVEKSILPKYQGNKTLFDESAYSIDLSRIRGAYVNANDDEKKQLENILNQHTWLACVHASGKTPDRIVWKKPGGASDLFEKTADHEIWLDGLEDVDAYFLHPSVIEILNGEAIGLANAATSLTLNLSSNDYRIALESEKYVCHKRGLKGFNPSATVIGVNSALSYWNQNRSRVLWKILLASPLKMICGETQSSSNRQKLDNAPREREFTEVGELCRRKPWLPDKSGKMCESGKMSLTDLPEGFESTSIAAKEVAERLGMKKPEIEEALDQITGGDPDFRKMIEYFQSASEKERQKLIKLIPAEVPSQPAPSFKEGLKTLSRRQRGIINTNNEARSPVSNPDRYQQKIEEDIETEVRNYHSSLLIISFVPVRKNPSNKDARDFLYEQYRGRCQITGTTFPKAPRNTNGMAENYFEACALLSCTNADYLNHPGNMLCVSADSMAKLKYANVSIDVAEIGTAIDEFKQNDNHSEFMTIPIRLADENCKITWTQRHFMHLVGLWDKA